MTEQVIRQRFHGLYLSRRCEDITKLSHKLLGLHCWFHRNVVFSSLIRGADITGWKTRLTKTWLYRGTLHGVVFEDLSKLLSLHIGEAWISRYYSERMINDISDEVIRCMEDGIYSRAQMRKIFSDYYEHDVISTIFSPWGGIFVHLAGLGKVAFRDMTSRDFDLIDAQPNYTKEEILPEILGRYFKSYGPATIEDALYFLGFRKEENKKIINNISLDKFEKTELNRRIYYHNEETRTMNDIPEYNLLSGFDPFIVSYTERSAVLPAEYKNKVILKSGICLPTILVNGRVAGIWNIKKGEPTVEFFEQQPVRVTKGILEMVDNIRLRIAVQSGI